MYFVIRDLFQILIVYILVTTLTPSSLPFRAPPLPIFCLSFLHSHLFTFSLPDKVLFSTPEAQKPSWHRGIAIRKVFARPESFCAYNRKIPCQLSQYIQNDPNFSRRLPIFRIISKLSGFFQMAANLPDYFKTVRIFPDDCQFSR